MSETMKSNPIEDELDAIRIMIYEQTKDMSSEERVAYFNRRTEEAFAQYGITPKMITAPIVKRTNLLSTFQ